MAAILALETSSDSCSVALGVDGDVLREEHDAPRAHARVLLPAIAGLLTRAGLEAGRLDAIVYGCGPGSFTGLRIGCAVVQGLAWAQQVPTLGISSLAVLADAAFDAADEEVAGVFTVLDARMDECYLSVRRPDAARSAVVEDRLVSRSEVAALVAQAVDGQPGRWLLAGDGVEAAGLAAGELAAGILLEPVPGARPHAAALLALAAQRLPRDAVPAVEVKPVYLRDESRWRRQSPRGA